MRERTLSNLAGRTVEYGPQNCAITARVLTERYNNVLYLKFKMQFQKHFLGQNET